MKTIAKVAVLTHLNQQFDYELLHAAKPGCRVRIPFGRRKIVGVIMDISHDTEIGLDKLKCIEEVIDQSPLFSQALLAFYQWQALYYFFPIGEILRFALPKKLDLNQPITEPLDTIWQITDLGLAMQPTLKANARLQKKALNLLAEHQEISETDLKNHGLSKKILTDLQAKGFVKQLQLPKTRATIVSGDKKRLSDAQKQCVDRLNTFDTFSCTLLQGVTGSGKTEVYFSVIDSVIEKGQQVLVLVPEISLTPQMVERFKQRFGQQVGVYHSNLNDTQRYETWLALVTGHLSILIGTRSAIFLPIPKLGLIIIDEEHDSSFKQQDRLRYSARDSAIKRAQLENIPIILGSATPSLESLYNAKEGKYHHLELTQRANNAKLPKVQLVDIRNQKLLEGFTKTTLKAIQAELNAGQHVLVLINRRGFAPILICHHCGFVAKCNHCDANLTVHFDPFELQCHHCDAHQPIYASCPECQRTDIGPFGHGTERCEQELKRQFPDTDIIRVDRDTTRGKQSMQTIVQRMQKPQPAILVGTQLLAKGHDFATITLVVILNIDTGLFSTDFRGTEKMAQLFLQASGRAGRGENPGNVLVQTHHPDHPLFKLLSQHNYTEIANMLLAERKMANLPPYSYQALIRAESSFPDNAKDFLTSIKQNMAPVAKNLPDIEIFGPIAALMEKRAGKYRANLLIQAKKRPTLLRFITHIHAKIADKNTKAIRWSIDIDPIDIA